MLLSSKGERVTDGQQWIVAVSSDGSSLDWQRLHSKRLVSSMNTEPSEWNFKVSM